MAEAATVLQLIQLSSTVIKHCYEFIRKAKTAPIEIQRVGDEATIMKGLLEQLKVIAENPDEQHSTILISLNRPDRAFAICSKAMQELDESLTSLFDTNGILRRLKWTQVAKGIDHILKRISEQKQHLYLALAGDLTIEQKSIQTTVVEVRDTVRDLKTAEERKKILAWLKAPDPSVNHNAATSKREPETCNWLLRSEEFKSWMTERSTQLMWLHGIPGAGKTIICSAVIEYLQSLALTSGYTVLYYYFDFSDSSRQTFDGFIRSLLVQTYNKTLSIPQTVCDLYAETGGSSPSPTRLLETFKAILQHQLRTFIIVDGLDECLEDKNERSSAIRTIKEIYALRDVDVSIFVASRPEIDIGNSVGKLCTIDIETQDTMIDEDIRRHIKACFANPEDRLGRWTQSLKDEIEDALMKKAGGM